ncbi:MAG: amidase [Leptospiraceae bacterium]|nr:MAG: amidase [Leptospiraceae bacterium]
MNFTEYIKYDAIGLAELIKKKEVKPEEIIEIAIQSIEKINPKINAIIYKMYDEIEKQLQQNQDGPLYGVPFLLKDLITAYKGVPLTSGSKAYKDYIPYFDSELTKRYKKAGFIILGKTNTPELGLMGYTEPEFTGPTRNPWNLDYTPGGSSGGSAAAVCSGIVPVAGGGDGGGSIRIPSAYCGLFGLKPSRGRVPTGPHYRELWQGMAIEHVITRSVRDSAFILDLIQGKDIGASFEIKPPEKPYIEAIKKPPKQLKIAISTESPIHRDIHPECINAVKEAAKLCENLGHIIEYNKPNIDGEQLAKSYMMLYFGEVAAEFLYYKNLYGKKAKFSNFEISTRVLNLLGNTYKAGDFVYTLRYWNEVSREIGKFFTKYDIWITPTTAQPPAKIGSQKLKKWEEIASYIIVNLKLGKLLQFSGMVEEIAIKNLERVPFTQIANVTGIPAMSVPLYFKDFPYGVQFMADFGREDLLLQLAHQLEQEKPWFYKLPDLEQLIT